VAREIFTPYNHGIIDLAVKKSKSYNRTIEVQFPQFLTFLASSLR